MTSTARQARTAKGKSPTRASAQRQAAASERAAEVRRRERRRRGQRWSAAIAAGLAIAAAGSFLATRGGGAGSDLTAMPQVGGDLHTLTATPDALYVGGHAAAAVSHDGGRQWQQVPSLEGADPMGWAQTPTGLLVGGHPGLYRSTDGGTTFTRATGNAAVPDVHALGAVGTTVYLASPTAGLLVSDDSGSTWSTQNADVGQSFMGTILVDPADPQHLIAPDMANGLLASSDGGRSWTASGGPKGAMAVAWDPQDLKHIVAVGMMDSAVSADGGRTWTALEVPAGTSAVAFSTDGQTLYASALDGESAVTSASTDGGASWDRP